MKYYWLQLYNPTNYSESNLEWDILNPNYLIWESNGHTFDFLLNPFFLGYYRETSSKVPPVSIYNLIRRAKFQIYRLHIRDSDWLNFIHFSGNKDTIRLISMLRKREDQALISISTILKFSVQAFRTLYGFHDKISWIF